MKTHQSLFTSVLVIFFGVMVAGSVLAVPPNLSSSRLVSVAGTAEGLPAGTSSYEVVDITGIARITATSIPSDTTTPDVIAAPSVVVDIEFLNAKGRGRTTHQLYQSIGRDRSILTMPLSSSVTAEADVLIFPVSHLSLANRAKVNHTPAHLAFTLNFNSAGAFIRAAATPLVTPPPTSFQ